MGFPYLLLEWILDVMHYELRLKCFPLKMSFQYDNEQGKSNQFFFDVAASVQETATFPQMTTFHTLLVLGKNDEAIYINGQTGEVKTTIILFKYQEKGQYGDETNIYTNLVPSEVTNYHTIDPICTFQLQTDDMGL